MYGRAYILGGKYQDVVKRSKAKHKALLCQTRDKFLPDITPLTKTLAIDRTTESIEWYGLWDDGHSFSNKDDSLVISLAKKLEAIAQKAPEKDFYYAPYLEHRKSAAYMLKLFSNISTVAPSLTLVNSAISGGGEWLNHPTYRDEYHLDGGLPKPKGIYLVSVDGRANEKKGHGNGSVDMPHEKLVAEHPNAIIWMDWITQDNGKYGPKDKRKRNERDAWLYPDLDDSVCFLTNDPGEMSLAKGHIWKSHGEQDEHKPIPDADDNKPAYISNGPQYKKVEIKTISGKVLETVTKSVKFKHGPGYLYRFKRWGFKYAQLAKKDTGKFTCVLVCDGKEIGRFNPGFRIPGR
jgi:hypothetical protein